MKLQLFYRVRSLALGLVMSTTALFASCGSNSSTPTTPILYATWGTAQERWAGGQFGTLLHYTQSTGKWVPSPQSQILTKHDFTGIWGASANDVWAVSDIELTDTPIKGNIWHYNGTEWSVAYSIANGFSRVWGSSSTDVWVVGKEGVIVHYDGTKWTQISSGVTWFLQSIWGSGPNDIWVGGGSLPGTGPNPTATTNMIHYDGTSWKVVFSNANVLINGIWGTGPNNVYAVGFNKTLIHFNGVGWSPVPIDTQFSYYHNIWGTSASDIWIIGEKRSAHYDGTNWTEISYPSGFTGSSGSDFTSIWGTSSTEIWIVGPSGPNAILHLNTQPSPPEWIVVPS